MARGGRFITEYGKTQRSTRILSHPIRSELEAFIEESVNFGVVVFLDPPINVK